jgi:hypothetical protein
MIEQAAAAATNAAQTNAIQPSDVLQADATVIAGVLIFLTIGPLSTSMHDRILERRPVLWGTYVTLGFLTLSIGVVLMAPFLQFISGLILLFGLVSIMITIVTAIR